ncbi:AAA family ATPase [Phyllobacterium trifolii]|uniref:AAA family ATPase n=1 Tax=Phyllobacterium trifolii TaxID=300193 RepID=UPI001FE3E980|nr:AAA family ATPase [Phyllobacterium trifolii]
MRARALAAMNGYGAVWHSADSVAHGLLLISVHSYYSFHLTPNTHSPTFLLYISPKRLALAIKKIVDERRRMGQFILTGSSNVFTSAHVADSLTGRVQTLTMLPMSVAEISQKGPARILDWANRAEGPTLADLPMPDKVSRSTYVDMMLAGGYPEIRSLEDRRRRRRYRDYVDTIVERDVADIFEIRKSDAMSRLIDQLAARIANELNVQDLSGKIGMQRKTKDTYLDVEAIAFGFEEL